MPLIRRDRASPSPPKGDPRKDLMSGLTETRWSAARALSGDAAAVGDLANALLREEEPRVREAILTGLARAGTPQAVEAVLGQLRSDDAGQRTAALDALRAMPAAVWPKAPQLLQDPDSDVRLLACELARDAPSEEAEAVLCALLDREAEVNVCAAAVEVLAEVGAAAALPALERCAQRFASDGFLRFAVATAIDRIASQAARPRG